MMKRKSIDVVQCFGTIIKHKTTELEDEVKSATQKVNNDYASRNMLRSSAYVFASDKAAEDVITNAYKDVMIELFTHLNAEYISIKPAELESIKILLNESVKEIATKIRPNFDNIIANLGDVRPKQIEAMMQGAGSNLLSYADMKYDELLLNRKSIVIAQSNRSFWFGAISILISVVALLISALSA